MHPDASLQKAMAFPRVRGLRRMQMVCERRAVLLEILHVDRRGWPSRHRYRRAVGPARNSSTLRAPHRQRRLLSIGAWHNPVCVLAAIA